MFWGMYCFALHSGWICMAGCWINLASHSSWGWEEGLGLSGASMSKGFQNIVKHKRLFWKLYSHLLNTVQSPLHALDSYNRLNYLKLLKNERPTWCHLLFYFTSYVLNMFRTLIYPSSGACDCVVELPHRLSCSQFVVCWRFDAAGFWVVLVLQAEAWWIY